VPARRIFPRLGVLVTSLVLLTLGLAACGGDGETSTTTATVETTETTATTTETTTQTTTETTAPQPAVMRIVVRGGRPVGGIERARFDQGERVTVVVISDVADEVHLHGYDLSADTGPGQTARIVFVADIPGRFEIELESRGLQIGDLEIRP
jgi:hypothetical protein